MREVGVAEKRMQKKNRQSVETAKATLVWIGRIFTNSWKSSFFEMKEKTVKIGWIVSNFYVTSKIFPRLHFIKPINPILAQFPTEPSELWFISKWKIHLVNSPLPLSCWLEDLNIFYVCQEYDGWRTSEKPFDWITLTLNAFFLFFI